MEELFEHPREIMRMRRRLFETPTSGSTRLADERSLMSRSFDRPDYFWQNYEETWRGSMLPLVPAFLFAVANQLARYLSLQLVQVQIFIQAAVRLASPLLANTGE
jgi:hypothetical protein